MKNKTMKQSPLEILICIVDKKMGEEATTILENNGYHTYLKTIGTGTTAKSKTGDFFGFGIIEREVIIALLDKDSINRITPILTESLNLEKPHTGILITIPLSSATSEVLDAFGINY